MLICYGISNDTILNNHIVYITYLLYCCYYCYYVL